MIRACLLIRLAAVAWLMSGTAVGCAQHRFPAIDQTGQRIFSGTTTLAKHDWKQLFHHKQPAAAPIAVAPAAVAPTIVAPAVQPPCTPPVAVVPVVPVVPIVAVPHSQVPVLPAACGPGQLATQTPLPGRPQAGGAQGPTCPEPPGPELMVTPARIVAPVNTEVVMAAGICGPGGYYVMRQPLEWMLAQDGVGQIVAVGHESQHDTSFLLRGSPQKLATNYARAHTSSIAQVVNRGTRSRADDVCLQKGQSWISVTSPTEGASHIVVWAPKELNWERRKATATIYWVDAAWRLPQSTTSRSGQPVPLTTVLTRSSGDPLHGWIVKYDVVEGPPANFGRGLQSVEVRTDAAGRATADLAPASLEPGITTVRVQVIRPAAVRGELPQMVVGQGLAGVQWTTPGLSVRALGSSVSSADGTLGYRVEVSNSGDLTTHNAALSFTPPTGVTVLNSTPAAQIFGQRFEWRLGDLPAGTTRVVEINCRATAGGSIRSSFLATSTEVPRAEGRVTTDVAVNALSVKMTGPETVEVGREARFLIDITNVGSTRLTNVTARDVFDSGLAHAGGEQSPLVRALAAALEPGQTERMALTFVVTQPGRHCHRLDVAADGGHAAAARGCLTGTAAVVTTPQLGVRVQGPPSRRQGEVAAYTIELRNNGAAPATNVILAVNWGFHLELREATQGHEDDLPRQTTRWRIAQLSPGETITQQLNFQCLNADPQGAVVRATVTSQQTSAVTSQAATVIAPGAAQPAPPSTPQPAGPAPAAPRTDGGGLKITASALANPIMAGGATTLLISLTNDRSVPDQNVALSVAAAGEGLSIRVAGTAPTPTSAASAMAIDFAPVKEMRPGETLPTPYRLEVRGVRPGRYSVRATVTSALQRQPVVAETEIVVNAP